MKVIVHFTHPNGIEDKFHFQGTTEAIRKSVIHNLQLRGCDISLAWTEEFTEPHFTKV